MAPRVKKNRPIMEHRPVTGMIIRRAALRERGEQVKGEQGSRRSPSAEHRPMKQSRARFRARHGHGHGRGHEPSTKTQGRQPLRSIFRSTDANFFRRQGVARIRVTRIPLRIGHFFEKFIGFLPLKTALPYVRLSIFDFRSSIWLPRRGRAVVGLPQRTPRPLRDWGQGVTKR